jgi:hypothetical protein
MMKFLANHEKTRALLKKWSGTNRLIIARHAFWSPGVPLQSSVQGCLQDVLYQILGRDPRLLPQVCPEEWDAMEPDTPWTVSKLWSSLSRAASAFSGNVCLLIDGLDECQPEADLAGFLVHLKKLQTWSKFKVMIFSRPWPQFERAFGGRHPSMTMEVVNRNDIIAYVKERFLAASPLLFEGVDWSNAESREEHHLAQKLVSKMIDKSAGVFLWTSLLVDDLPEGL